MKSPIGNEFTNKAEILMTNFSLLNIEMKLKGTANNEAQNVTDIKTFNIDSTFALEVSAEMHKDIGIIEIVANAIKNEILVNVFKFSLFKKLPPFTKNIIVLVFYIQFIINLLN
ncbi:sodium:proton antiporter [Bacillus anthracis]|uniref:sodium:proton antiporter n=1 Tax=Bacillus anthracis TaxID=1392 RepID=UPI003B9FDEA9